MLSRTSWFKSSAHRRGHAPRVRLPRGGRAPYLACCPFLFGSHVETHGPLGTLWAGLGLGAFFIALTWVNLLLGHFLTPLFLIPTTWLMDAMKQRKERTA